MVRGKSMSYPSEVSLLDYIESKLVNREREKIEHYLKFYSGFVTAFSMDQAIPC